MQGLESLTQLRRLSLRDNELADVDALASLGLLEDLSLGENRIAKVRPARFDTAVMALVE